MTETGILTVETSGVLDTYLEAYDTLHNLLGENDDGDDDYNARLAIFAEANISYLFKLRGYDEDETGEYEIRATANSVRDLRPGIWHSGSISEDEEIWYSVRSAETGIMIIETSGDTDTYINAYDSSLKSIGEDDDGGDELNARLEIFTEAANTYYFKLTACENESGPYSIRAFSEIIPPDLEQNTESSMAAALKLGEPNQVYLRSPNESRWYRYDIPRRGTTFIVQTRGSMDTTLFLYDAAGNEIAEDDDSGDGINAMISERLDSGTVYIEVSEYDGKTGHCTLHAEIR
jgi:catechol 2,3-dioxygenase-like lactoylglutathione lyase family enzyme